MSDTSPFGFGRFVPGFDFLQNLAKGSAAGMPSMSHWVAPTVSVEELDKRIEELKAVQFWLEQNARALAATVQALEVQKMTLATLQGMNVAMGDLAGAFAGKGADAFAPPPGAARAAERSQPPEPVHAHDGVEAQEKDEGADDADKPEDGGAEPTAAAPGVVDPLQWWTALGTQFQQIAANAMKDATAQQAALDATRDMTAQALKTATGMASHFAAQGAPGGQEAAGTAAKPKTPRRKAGAATPSAPAAARRRSAGPAPSAAPAPSRSRKAAAAAPAPAAARKAPARRTGR